MSAEVVRCLPRFIKDINLIQPEYDLSDRVWRLPMRFGAAPNDWTMLHVSLYENTYFCYWTAWDISLKLSLKGKINKPAHWSLDDKDSKKFEFMLTRFSAVAKRITTDWLQVYRETLKSLSLDMRYGILPKSVVWKYYPELYRVDIAWGKMKTAQFINYVRSGKFRCDYAGHHREMSLALFMQLFYCIFKDIK